MLARAALEASHGNTTEEVAAAELRATAAGEGHEEGSSVMKVQMEY